MLNKKNQSNIIRIILMILCITTAQADACLERVKKWWAKPAQKNAATRTTTVPLPMADNPFPPGITLIVLEYLKRTEKAAYVSLNNATGRAIEIDHIGICDSADRMHIFADRTGGTWLWKKATVMRMAQHDLLALYGNLLKRDGSVENTYSIAEPNSTQQNFLREQAQIFHGIAPRNAGFFLIERHDATQQTTERLFFMPGPEELYLEKESRKGLFSCCRKQRGRITIQEEKEEENKED